MNKRKYTTIHDIAAKAGVSVSTVSRVLTGNAPVTDDKRAAVLSAMDLLNYRPSMVARGLVQGKSATIGVLTQNMASLFYGELIKGIERGLAGSDYHPLIASGNWHLDEELAGLDLLLERRVDALIVLNGQVPEERLREIAADQVPVVVVGRTITGLEGHCLLVKNVEGAYQATRYLIDAGHTRIAHITGTLSQRDAVERREGYYGALRDAGLPIDPDLVVEGDFEEPSGIYATRILLERGLPLTAIFAANDQIAYGARLALYRAGVQVPEDVSLIGFDDQLGSSYTTPPLTTVRQPLLEMGMAAAGAVLQLLAGTPLTLPVFATELIVRDSTRRL